MKIEGSCRKCHVPFTAADLGEMCPQCSEALFREGQSSAFSWNHCPSCASHLYQQKDFNRALGVTLVVVGIILAYWTYGLSLLAVTLLDLVLYRRVGLVGICYLCNTQFRGAEVTIFPPFDLVHFDHYRAVKQNRK